ncbi:MAG: hypothetical protein A2W91_09880 [Bacteroidetes bacterium GWF2_38_335]|nr:MAG: hypothetical protein A2W91_09880 [Bacteroidetes bacterium GWF2_38_335]HBS88064.1 hypothetical protein [Bacteroidales bacterium]
MQNIWIVSLVVITTVFFSSCNEEKTSAEKKENTIVGKWEKINKNGFNLEFTESGKLYYWENGEYLTDSTGEKFSLDCSYEKISNEEFEVIYTEIPGYDTIQKLRILFIEPDIIKIMVITNDSIKVSEDKFHRVSSISE